MDDEFNHAIALKRLGRRAPRGGDKAMTPRTRVWVGRILVELDAHREFIRERGFRGDNLARVLGLGEWVDPEDRKFNAAKVRQLLRRIHAAAERKGSSIEDNPQLARNLGRLQVLLGLTDGDVALLEFAVYVHADHIIGSVTDLLGSLNSNRLMEYLGVILRLPDEAVRAALDSAGLLARTGLLTVDHNHNLSMDGKLDLLSPGFAGRISSVDADPLSLLQGTVNRAPGPDLSLDDYPHMHEQLQVLKPYLQRAQETARKGVNILIYGAPGTGKTQFVRAIARELGLDLFEVASQDANGDPCAPQSRLKAYGAAQSLLSRRGTLLLFDEVEDVFSDEDLFSAHKSTAQIRKAWINKALEENPVPCIMLSNSIRGVDRAFIRRFDQVFELPVPPKPVRERIIRRACADTLPEEAVSRIAEVACLTPAVVTRAASVVELIKDILGPQDSAASTEKLINATLRAQGHGGIARPGVGRFAPAYDLAFVNADCNLVEVMEGLLAAREGRLCLYGPPGTGKTGCGRWVAARMGAPLLVRRPSDLLGMYVGESEQNIARAFDEARESGAVLLMDEVDSFLQDRRGARCSWEVSQVNEMLTQMESFNGVFIASTNLMGSLDQASLRRFDLKIRFGYLTRDQAAALFRRYCQTLTLEPGAADVARVARLDNLTPGDFAVVVRQSRFRPIRSAAVLAAALDRECSAKEGAGRRPVGFIH